ncbi:exonuclease SbcCD subunit D [Candidatus Latescibacterota bacterium]
MIKFIHAADIHLDSPLRGLSRYEGDPEEEIRQATRRALENLVVLAQEAEVNFVLIAGDLYDGNWKDHNTGLFFAKQMSELRKADIKVFIVSGNHDAQSVITKSLKLPENVFQFSTKHAETQHLDNISVAIHGQGFPTKSVTNDLSFNYPIKVPDAFNIGLLHTSMTGREGHDNYAPCSAEGLVKRGYDYWALGHVHTQEQISADIPIWFSGNIQGRHIRETGKKGCLLVTVDDAGGVDTEFQELDVLRWLELPIDASKAKNPDDCIEVFREQLLSVLEQNDGRSIAMRVIVSGESEAHEKIVSRQESFLSDIRSVANDYGDGTVWVEKVALSTRPVMTQPQPHSLEGPLGELTSILDSLPADEDALAVLMNEFAPLLKKLPHELSEGPDSLQLNTSEKITAILKQVRPMLFTRLRGSDGAL